MSGRDGLRARVRNALFRAAHRVPRGAISPIVSNDLFHAHVSLFEFLGAFVSQRRTLFVGSEAFGAQTIRPGAASLTAVMTSAAALHYGRRTFTADGLEFRDTIPGSASFDVVIHSGEPPRDLQSLIRAVRPEGKLLISVTPAEDAPLREALSSRFANVRRFAHIANAPLDFSSPHSSALPHNALSFREIATSGPLPANTIGLVYLATDEAKWRDLQLHLGCGPITLDQWINIDNQPYAGIDFRWDLARGIPFRDARYIFAEHFIEHLSYQQGADFTRGCREALRDDGILRLSTPNLDWVWQVSYHPTMWTNEDEALRDCFVLNRAFRGWGHQFLYNLQTLTALLQNSGFANVQALRYGESDNPALAGIERHEQYPDVPELPHVLVIEARGRGEHPMRAEANIAEYNRDVATV
jgi:predicted SAM-dependent methyltransferase/SAM-dependent methyltransferase